MFGIGLEKLKHEKKIVWEEWHNQRSVVEATRHLEHLAIS